MENKDVDYIISEIKDKTRYQFREILIINDELGLFYEIVIDIPKPGYLEIYFEPGIKRIDICYWEDLGNPDLNTYTSNFDREDNQTMTYQECLSQFLKIWPSVKP